MEEAVVRLREMQEELSNFKNLLDSVGWKRLMEVADGQLETRMPSVLEKVDNLLMVTGKEFEKGEMAGINLFMQLPGIAVESLTADIDTLEKELDYGDGSRTSGDPGDGDRDTGSLYEPAAP